MTTPKKTTRRPARKTAARRTTTHARKTTMPTTVTEAGEMGVPTEDAITLNVRGAFGVMRYLRMIPGSAALADPVWIEPSQVLTSPAAGTWHPAVSADQRIAELLREMMARGEEAPSIDDIEVAAEEYPELLKKAYRAADFEKPRNFIGLFKDLPVAEMEQLMIASTTVGDEDLRALAQRRAQVVKDWLSGEGQVPGERIFLLEPKVEAIGDGGQVAFALR